MTTIEYTYIPYYDFLLVETEEKKPSEKPIFIVEEKDKPLIRSKVVAVPREKEIAPGVFTNCGVRVGDIVLRQKGGLSVDIERPNLELIECNQVAMIIRTEAEPVRFNTEPDTCYCSKESVDCRCATEDVLPDWAESCEECECECKPEGESN